ncbi:MAG TPA: hypothetical protein VMS60_08650 [Solirubrobacterales bacterium]|nr:hypothetical protein [Solirubrobacterales bacterium]
MLKRRFALTCLLVFSALSVVACGNSGNSDESQIEEAIEASATSTDPADCTKLETQRFMEQTTQSEGAEAVARCEKQATEEKGSEAATASNIEVEGSKATADAAISGGSFDGQTVEVALVKEGNQWKLDELTGFAKFDTAKLIEAFEKTFADPSNRVSKSLASCLLESLEADSEEEFEGLMLSGSAKGFEEIAEACQ